MPLPIVYIETTIPSFYHETRMEPAMVARREWTREWWAAAQARYRLVTSEAVIEELARGAYNTREDALSLARELPILPVEPRVLEIVAVYIANTVMPRDPTGDAVHLALASYHACDFLVTWNCVHLAKANKFRHIARANASLGLATPTIVTPLELLGGSE